MRQSLHRERTCQQEERSQVSEVRTVHGHFYGDRRSEDGNCFLVRNEWLELTPQERQKIYLDEKARLEVRRELAGRKIGAGKLIGYVVPGGIGLLVVMFMIGSAIDQSQDAAFKRLTPEERHQETLKTCASLLRSFQYQTYSELSVRERQGKAECEAQLAHPEQDIIPPSSR